MKCGSCGAEVREGARFCGSCGAPADKRGYCTSCGAEMEAGMAFCAQCGSRRDGGSAPVSAVAPSRAPTPRTRKVSSRPPTAWWKRLGLLALGLLFLAYGISQELLLVIGESRSAVVTEVHMKTRQSASDGPNERYYEVSYRFSARDGSSHGGSFDFPVGEKQPPRVGSPVQIRYLSFYPTINGRDDGLSLSVTGLLMIGVGGLLAGLAFRS